MKTGFKLILLVIIALTVALSCKKDKKDNTENINREIYEMMSELYLWYDHLPSNIDPASYDTPEAFMDALRYPAYDKWSTVLTKDEFNQYFEEGTMIGHGFLLGLDESENVRVCFLYRQTEADVKGVKRSWILDKVNGHDVTPENVFTLLGDSRVGVSNTIAFLDGNGATVTLTLTKEEIDITPVLHYEILNQGTTKIGYMVFQDFIETADAELDEAFAAFTAGGIDEMIIDMRYNGGGSVDVAEYLAGWLIGKDFANEPFVNFRHNTKIARWDTTINVPVNNSGLSLSRIFFIGTSGTASASELVINGIKPFIGSILAGTTTHGKPVGMYAIPIDPYDYVTLPVTFKYTNKDNEGDFFNGIEPLLPSEDDLTRNFGDPEESSLKAILDYIETGTVPVKSTKSTGDRARLLEKPKAVNQYLKAY